MPTTEIPTTLTPTTETATTQTPTTQIPTTQTPTTETPTTQTPTTEIPTTEMKTTQMATTQIETTQIQTTQIETTQIPTTQIQTTQIPTTETPTTFSPPTQSPTLAPTLPPPPPNPCPCAVPSSCSTIFSFSKPIQSSSLYSLSLSSSGFTPGDSSICCTISIASPTGSLPLYTITGAGRLDPNTVQCYQGGKRGNNQVCANYMLQGSYSGLVSVSCCVTGNSRIQLKSTELYSVMGSNSGPSQTIQTVFSCPNSKLVHSTLD